MKLVIWSFEHNAWWGPEHCGYVSQLEKAGRYSEVEAGAIVIASVFLDEVAMYETIAIERGAPQYHPYHGKGRRDDPR